VPYLAEQARATIETNRPLMRGLFFGWPDDATVWAWPAQFLLGDDLLVHLAWLCFVDVDDVVVRVQLAQACWGERGAVHDP
jgi:hypothetical protein